MKRIVLLFDDLAKERNALAKGLRALLGATGEVQTFEGDVRPNGNESYDRYIAGWIEKTVGRANAALVVCDKELGAYSELRGLSATPVSAVATDLGIPFSQYSRQSGSGKRDLDRFRQLHRWSMDEVTLEGLTPGDWARETAILFKGFENIRKRWKSTRGCGRRRAIGTSTARTCSRPRAKSATTRSSR